ncbi:proline--tRNA ligase [Collibacillus ludicampi]|uniref:Proline--tRNA ligase n=1 Tax=Collibacillus ludicampi TaxID=2771369 RepID=A0AAV4LJ89_9BACL|nr:proline--tRNA ligase [Collibacillus ludicampi]GIM47835.1 proline--tRNA ligase [Collibacillus ludicampi]
MRQKKYFIPTLREVPSEAEIVSHQLLLRAGFIRQLAAGIYTYLPLGYRSLRKIEAIVREEMDKSGAQEIHCSFLQPIELWEQTGRAGAYGPELVRLHDRHEREFVLGPTHEEVFTTVVRNDIKSYRKLPLILYQIQTKFRDERRPRFGLMRGREFVMKDAYSFDLDWEGLDRSYRAMYDAYSRIFTRLGLNFRAVEADAGAIGGEGGTHEFMVLADVGEDTIASCTQCDYAANIEMASAGRKRKEYKEVSVAEREKFHTPDIKTIDQLSSTLGVEPSSFIKTLIYLADGKPVAVLVRGDHEVNEVKVKNVLGATEVSLADEATIRQVTGAPVGFAGPVGLSIPLLVDLEVAEMETAICGANEVDMHVRNVKPGRDFPLEQVADVRNVIVGDQCPHCDGHLEFHRGIEVGHIFKLGTKYSEALGATYLDQNGKEQVMIMGCYGIGVSRLLAAIVEQSHDDKGIIWPLAVAPFQVHIVPVNMNDQNQVQLAEQLYDRLVEAGVEVLLDDRDERPGVKFKDADLIGLPIRITIGKQAAEGLVEFKERKTEQVEVLSLEAVYERVLSLIKS